MKDKLLFVLGETCSSWNSITVQKRKMAREKDKTKCGRRAGRMKQVKSICAWVLDSFVSSPSLYLIYLSAILGRLLGRDEASLGRRTFTRVFMFYLGSTARFFLAVAGFSSGQEMGRDYNTNKVKQNRDTTRRVSTSACSFLLFSPPRKHNKRTTPSSSTQRATWAPFSQL